MRKNVYEYIPEYLRGIRELYEIADVFDYYIEEIYDAIVDGVYEKLVSYASEERISRWERLLEIAPEGTLTERRNVLKSIMRKNRKLDEETIKNMVKVITGGTVYMDFFDSTVVIRVKNAENTSGFTEAERMLKKALPAHLALSMRTFYPTWNDVKNSYGAWSDVASLSGWDELYDEVV
ncbi:MAG: hypothetical protein IJF98_08790 [Firmicutes bacterium]|nr:hypothetical protein [Bacillota bacterium]